MSKNRNKRQQPPRTKNHTAAPIQSMEAFTFGEPTPVLGRRNILDYVECIDNGQWYCKYPGKTAHPLLEIFRHTDYVP